MVPRCCDTVYSHQLRPQCQDMWKCNYRKGSHEATKDWGRRAWRKAETEQQEDRACFWEGTQVPGTGTCQIVYANVIYGGVRDHRGDPQDSDDLPWLQTGTQLHLERGFPPSPQHNPPVMLMVWLLILSLLGQLSVCSTVCEVQGLQGEDHPSPAKYWEDINSLGFGHQYWHSHKHHTNDSDFFF